MILIVGASGLLGREIAQQLIIRGEPLRLLTRTPSKLYDLQQDGVEIVEGDLIDPLSLVRACEGVDRVVAAAHSIMGRGKYSVERVDDLGHRSLITAAKKAGVSHFVYISVFGASPNHLVDFWRIKYNIEQYLKTSGLSYTILRPSAFMEVHAHLYNGKAILTSGKASLLGKGTRMRNFVAVKDVTYFALRALTDTKLVNRTLEIGGAGNYSDSQVSEMYFKTSGIPVKISRLPPGVLKVISAVAKPIHPGISRIMYINSLPDEVLQDSFDPGTLLAEFPRQFVTLEDFIQERIAVWKASKLSKQD
jgi:uncharacterized protein YbjT (DUF2867 family)